VHGKGVVHVMSHLDGCARRMQAERSHRGHRQAAGVFHQTCLPGVQYQSYAELDPRLFSYNSKHGWCPECVGTGVAS
jgi:excinuclease ABC subunit A